MARLHCPQGDGRPLRDHLMAVWRTTRQKPHELTLPPLPACLAALWSTYLQLDAGRGASGFGTAAIGWQDIAAWQSATGARISPWEADTLIYTDRAVRAVLQKD